MNITFHHLRIFVTVAKLESFTSAAKVLHISQGGVSAQIRALEEMTGLKLLDRNSRKVSLSLAGKDFLPYAEKTCEQFLLTTQFVQGLCNLKFGKISIATATLIGCTILPDIIASFLDIYPNIEVIPKDMSISHIQASIIRGDAEIGVGPERINETNCISRELFSQSAHVVCRKDHRFAGQKVLWQDLQNEPIIFVGNDAMERIAYDCGAIFKSSKSFVVNNTTTALSYAAIGRGVCIAAPFILPLAKAYDLGIYPIYEPIMQRKMMIYTHAEKVLSPAGVELYNHILTTTKVLCEKK